MNVTKKQLDNAVLHNIITQIEADRLYDFFTCPIRRST
jgi:hypothetical protein